MCRCEHPAVAEVTKTAVNGMTGGPDSPFKVCEGITLRLPIDVGQDDDDDADEVQDFDPESGTLMFHRRTGARIRIIGQDIVNTVGSAGYMWGQPFVRRSQQTAWIVEHESSDGYVNHYASDHVKILDAHQMMDYVPVRIGGDR